jgi:hypothetical protein
MWGILLCAWAHMIRAESLNKVGVMIHRECLCCILLVICMERSAGMTGGELCEVVELTVQADADWLGHLMMTAFVRLTGLTMLATAVTAATVTTAASTLAALPTQAHSGHSGCKIIISTSHI